VRLVVLACQTPKLPGRWKTNLKAAELNTMPPTKEADAERLPLIKKKVRSPRDKKEKEKRESKKNTAQKRPLPKDSRKPFYVQRGRQGGLIWDENSQNQRREPGRTEGRKNKTTVVIKRRSQFSRKKRKREEISTGGGEMVKGWGRGREKNA